MTNNANKNINTNNNTNNINNTNKINNNDGYIDNHNDSSAVIGHGPITAITNVSIIIVIMSIIIVV